MTAPAPAGSPLGALAPLAGMRFSQILNLVFFDTVTSTNDLARKIVEKMLAEGEELQPTAVVARRQTAGRGRAGRAWRQPEGAALSVSLIVPWPEGPDRVKLPIEMGVVLANGLSAKFGLDVRLKWPNDLLVSRKKLGGLLVEARAGDDGEGFAVVGIGLNVGATREELDAASLPEAASLRTAGVAAASFAGDAPLVALLAVLDEGLAAPKASLPEAFEKVSAHANGDRLRVADGEKTVEGTYLGVTAEGFLRLAVSGGEERIVSGDVAFF